ncbi:MAG: metallophosphoesterase [Candidatus Sulfotelmatobacter sp.]|jgi:predicted phosphodiesterase
MRIFALSDVHVDYDVNRKWVANISATDYCDDVLILAGDIADSLPLFDWCLNTMTRRFRKLLFVPGNHDLWVLHEAPEKDSLQKLQDVSAIVESSGASMQPFRERNVSIIPLLAWYDYSFGEPGEQLRSCWMDYHACRWPNGVREKEVAAYFAACNKQKVSGAGDTVITFSHFLPRLDLMPEYIPATFRYLYPVLGTTNLELQLRILNSGIHVYGHSHFNRSVSIDSVCYINNAYGYPNETRIASKRLLCVHER